MEMARPSELCMEFAKVLDSTAQVINGVCIASRLRTNIHPTVLGRKAESAMFLPQIFSFENMDSKEQALCLGETVILEEEINPFMNVLQKHGIIVTAVHNHWLFDKPRLMYMHFESIDHPIAFARKTEEALNVLITASVTGNSDAHQTTVPIYNSVVKNNSEMPMPASLCDEFNDLLGGSMHTYENEVCVVMNTRNNLNPVVLGRKGQSFLLGTEMYVFESMSNDGSALCSGEIALLQVEVNAFVWMLQKHGIIVTAIHNHWLFDDPQLMYMHFASVDNPIAFAKNVRDAKSVLLTQEV